MHWILRCNRISNSTRYNRNKISIYSFFSTPFLTWMNSWTFLCWQICYLFSSVERWQIYFCLEPGEKHCHAIHKYNYVLVKEVVLYREFNRRRQIWRTAESLDELKEDLKVNWFQSPVMLATEPVSYRCNLHNDSHRMTCATDLYLMWVQVRVLRLSLGLANNYLKVPKVPESFPNLPCPCKFGSTTFRGKES